MNNKLPKHPANLVNVKNLTDKLEQFATDRNWKQFHSPKNLILALVGEVGELSEIFQWMSETESKTIKDNPITAQAVKDELADILFYLVRLASILDLDLNEAAIQKLKINSLKYPIQTSLGVSTKYNKK